MSKVPNIINPNFRRLLLAVGLLTMLAACAPAEYQMINSDLESVQTNNVCVNCPPDTTPTPTPPGTTPTPPGTTPTPTPTPSPTPCACTVKAWLKIDSISAKDSSGRTFGVCVKEAQVELCALSKDFFGHLKTQISPNWTGISSVKEVDLILSSYTANNRVEAANGMKLCNLKLKSTAMNRVIFVSDSGQAIPVSSSTKYIYNFQDSDAVNSIGGGNCELRVPGGQYRLKK